MSSKKLLRIAIDGPAGAGKSTVARGVARALGYTFVDTGAMYRAVAWKAQQSGLTLDQEDSLVQLAAEIELAFTEGEDGRQHVWIDGVDRTDEIRQPEVTEFASPVSAIPGVRAHLVAKQRQFAAGGGVVMEGRDIQTVVMPEAEVKVFLNASLKERARRRYAELRARGVEVELEEVAARIRERDERDSRRAIAPLRPAEEAILIDTDPLTAEEVVAQVVARAREVAAE